MSRTWFRQLRKHLRGGTHRSRPACRQPRSVRPAGEFLEARELLSGAVPVIGGGLVGDPVDIVDMSGQTQLSVTQWDVNQPYTGTISGFGSGSLKVSGLPPGLNASMTGTDITFRGTPTQAGAFEISVDTIKGAGTSHEVDYSGLYFLTINPALSLGSLSAAPWTAGRAGTAALALSGGTPPFGRLAVTGLPPGLTATLSPGAITISGTPTQAGTFSNIAVSLQDGIGVTVQETCSVMVNLAVSPGTLPADTAGVSYGTTFSAAGGSGHYGFAVVSGALPTGLSLSSGGVLSGTTTVAGTYAFTVQATDTAIAGVFGTAAYQLTVNPAAASQVLFSTQPPAILAAGAEFHVVVQAEDRYGNPVPNTPLTVVSSVPGLAGGTGIGTVTTDGRGQATFGNKNDEYFLSYTVVGGYQLTATIPGVAGATSNEFYVVPAAVASVVVTPSTSTPTAGTFFTVTVTAKDAYGNSEDGVKATLTGSEWPSQPQQLYLNGGSVTFPVWLRTAHAVTLTATTGGVTGSCRVFVSPATPVQLVISSSITTGSPGGRTTVLVTAQDNWGNSYLYSGAVNLTSNNNQVVSSGTVNVKNGQFPLTLNQPGKATLSVSAGSVQSNSITISVNPPSVGVNPTLYEFDFELDASDENGPFRTEDISFTDDSLADAYAFAEGYGNWWAEQLSKDPDAVGTINVIATLLGDPIKL